MYLSLVVKYLDVESSGYQHMRWKFPSDLIHVSADAIESSPKGLVVDIINTLSRVCKTVWFSGHPSLISNATTLGVCGEGDYVLTVAPDSHENVHQCGSSRQRARLNRQSAQ